MSAITVSDEVVDETLAILRRAGLARRECVALWLAADDDGDCEVVEVFVPPHEASDDYFHVPRESIAALLDKIARDSRRVVAQVHSHPAEAFHSLADDRWALVRHVGALSLVIPWFASRTTVASFWSDAAVFALSSDNRWLQVRGAVRAKYLRGVS